jgi:hypothetical protein
MVNNKHLCNVAFINVISKVFTSAFVVSFVSQVSDEEEKRFITLSPEGQALVQDLVRGPVFSYRTIMPLHHIRLLR